MDEFALAEDFQFDAQGFLMLRNVFDAERCRRYLEELERLFKSKYDDPWLHDGVRGQTTVQISPKASGGLTVCRCGRKCLTRSSALRRR